MNPEDDALYFQREQSQIKHIVLENYLERFAIIVGKWSDGILYVDGFSGPWNSVSKDFKDSSFAIALRQLRSARTAVKKTFGRELRITCVFLERDPTAFTQLEAYSSQQKDVEIILLNRDFEPAIPELVSIIRARQPGYFPFVLIDPTGWSGFSMEVIAPLLRIRPCELLINFMTSFITRFIDDEREGIEASFRRLFGDDSYRLRIEGLENIAREDAMVSAYADRIAQVGDFNLMASTVVLHPTKDRTHFHLVYATRSLRGLEVFKTAERAALKLTETVRADAKRRDRERISGQSELFGGRDIPEIAHLDFLRNHYENASAKEIRRMLNLTEEVTYDALYATTMKFPVVQEAFLKKWISENAHVVTNDGSKAPKIGNKHLVRRRPSVRFQ